MMRGCTSETCGAALRDDTLHDVGGRPGLHQSRFFWRSKWSSCNDELKYAPCFVISGIDLQNPPVILILGCQILFRSGTDGDVRIRRGRTLPTSWQLRAALR